jgi:uncharacterized membrane protein YgdD (TMEM256/DUF423 family)
MPTSTRYFAAFAALALAVATGLGAWASHGLAGALPPARLASLESAIDYQFFHSLGLLVLVALTGRRRPAVTLLAAMAAVAAGLVLFCGGVYASSLGGPVLLARAAPFGGALLIAGWIAAAIALLTTVSVDRS